MTRVALMVLLTGVALACSGGAEGPGDVVGDAASEVDASIPCDQWNPYAEVDPDTAAPCDPSAESWRACAEGGSDGFQRCLYVTTGEDVGVHRWGPCEGRCGDHPVGSTRPCEVNGTPGVQYCGEEYGVEAPIWRGCLPERCIVCTLGDTKFCGPGTNYPDSLMTCILSNGVPQWFDGDCTT